MHYDGSKICAVPDALGGGDCQWPMREVTVYSEGLLGRVDIEEATRQAVDGWNRVCGINLRPSANRATAHIVVTKGGIDGPAGTLAWSELPCFGGARIRQLTQRYDINEAWVIAENPAPHQIDLVRVMCHELGHAIGISHISNGNLMQPAYDGRIRWPKRGDIQEARSRYGLPAEIPDEPDDPGVPGIPGECLGMSPDEWQTIFKAGSLLAKKIGPLLTTDQRQLIERMLRR